MSITLSKEKLIEITAGHASAGAQRIAFQGAEFDSRRVRGGELFAALPGEREHGHAYVGGALERGAALCLVEDIAACGMLPEPERLVAVKDSLAAFQSLAAWWRHELKLPLAAVTGSMGKTTVKELAAAMLLKQSRGLYSLKSYNNHVGVPYTLCQAGPEHRWIVVEMGMNHPGELAPLARMAAPDVGVILGVSTVHTHVFENLEQIADAKSEIMDGMQDGARLVVNGDDERVLAAVRRRDPHGRLKILKVGYGAGCEARVVEVQSRGLEGLCCRLLLCGEELNLESRLLGRHNAFNIAAAALTVKTLVPEISSRQIADAVSGFISPAMRLNLRRIAADRIVVDDTYNANPPAMRSLFELVKETVAAGEVVGLLLGDMLELGDLAAGFHREIAAAAVRLQPAFIVAVGEYAPFYSEAGKDCGLKVFEAGSAVAAAHILHKLPFNVLFAKGSRGVGLDKTVGTLLELEGEMLPQMQHGFTKIKG